MGCSEMKTRSFVDTISSNMVETWLFLNNGEYKHAVQFYVRCSHISHCQLIFTVAKRGSSRNHFWQDCAYRACSTLSHALISLSSFIDISKFYEIVCKMRYRKFLFSFIQSTCTRHLAFSDTLRIENETGRKDGKQIYSHLAYPLCEIARDLTCQSVIRVWKHNRGPRKTKGRASYRGKGVSGPRADAYADRSNRRPNAHEFLKNTFARSRDKGFARVRLSVSRGRFVLSRAYFIERVIQPCWLRVCAGAFGVRQA